MTRRLRRQAPIRRHHQPASLSPMGQTPCGAPVGFYPAPTREGCRSLPATQRPPVILRASPSVNMRVYSCRWRVTLALNDAPITSPLILPPISVRVPVNLGWRMIRAVFPEIET